MTAELIKMVQYLVQVVQAGPRPNLSGPSHCWEPTVFPGEKRIQNGDILVFIVNIEKLYFIMNHFAIYTIKTKTNGFFMRFYSRTIVGSQLWVDI